MHKVLRRLRSSEAGMSLLEVLIAIIIFAVVSLGVLHTLTTVLSTTRDNRARVVAANLAAEEIDLARAADEVFNLFDATRVVPINGDDYTVTRTTEWVSSDVASAACGTGTGALRYKRINVEVSWPNMREGTSPVSADTLLAPSERINDPALGTILVSVLGGTGEGVSGVTVSATPASPSAGAQTPSTTIKATDVQGCTFILKVTPGNYNVTVSKTNYITEAGQSTVPSQLAKVTAGSASSMSFNYDEAASFAVKYVSASTPSKAQMPKDMATSFVSTYSTYTTSTSSTSFSRTVKLFPWRSGYVSMAGTYIPESADPTSTVATCLSPNTALWPDKLVGTVTYASPAAEAVAANPGGTVTAVVPMGLVEVSGMSGATIRAVPAAPVANSGDPGCDARTTLYFSTISSTTNSIALPYGTWQIQKYGALTGWTSSGLSAVLNPIFGGGTSTTGIVTVDPRVAS
ncbi:prepilin-type N-terminal cleavage/methylation domain-containing protein [Salinibacterium sp. NK8237]|uniref:type IV pilus modification PilV family protein n=1 Tax=Salinibacterium sp. NK8237 TaxID=2792038 RepID=UPI0018CEA785|nr:prepilin-type N-terminal cleavage/methylation domain-containing protein [Salinibacterium sp. NK8237]MBH0129941.1 prepilin-type N-terminal cleavage/methylation domain-containing protein [Salinibacterium sp. NK8237]